MTKRILILECKQEVSTFNPVLSRYDDFLVTRGQAMSDLHAQARNEVGGACSVFAAQDDVEIVTVYSARAITSGGTLAAADWHKLAQEFLQALQAALPADGIYFALHGAMAAENEDDPEGYLLQEARNLAGKHMPIVASFDLHGILTERMLQHASAVNCFHTYPHVDFYETGERAAWLLVKILAGARPTTARVFIPALVRGDELITQTGLIRHAVDAAKALEESGEALSAGLFWGNPFTDVHELGSNSFVVTDGDTASAERAAQHIAELFWQHRQAMRVPLTSLADAVSMTQANVGRGTTVLVDAADATSSGASGDSNVLLRALVEAGYSGRALIPIVDPVAVRAAFAAGVGQPVQVSVGGALDPRYVPMTLNSTVHVLSDGHFLSESFSEQWHAGQTAVVKVGDITLVITSRPVSLFDRALFWANGQDPKKFDCVVVKSPQCEPHMFRTWAAQYIDVDAPGATSANIKSLGHTRCPRPMWPLDEQVDFAPHAQVFAQ